MVVDTFLAWIRDYVIGTLLSRWGWDAEAKCAPNRSRGVLKELGCPTGRSSQLPS
jgi:hypothetical protein